MGVLLKTTVTDLGEVEEALDDPEGVLDAAAGLGLYAVAGTLGLVDDALVASAAIREVTGLRGVFLEDIGLVGEGALMIAASTIVPFVTRTPWDSRCR